MTGVCIATPLGHGLDLVSGENIIVQIGRSKKFNAIVYRARGALWASEPEPEVDLDYFESDLSDDDDENSPENLHQNILEGMCWWEK